MNNISTTTTTTTTTPTAAAFSRRCRGRIIVAQQQQQQQRKNEGNNYNSDNDDNNTIIKSPTSSSSSSSSSLSPPAFIRRSRQSRCDRSTITCTANNKECSSRQVLHLAQQVENESQTYYFKEKIKRVNNKDQGTCSTNTNKIISTTSASISTTSTAITTNKAGGTLLKNPTIMMDDDVVVAVNFVNDCIVGCKEKEILVEVDKGEEEERKHDIMIEVVDESESEIKIKMNDKEDHERTTINEIQKRIIIESSSSKSSSATKTDTDTNTDTNRVCCTLLNSVVDDDDDDIIIVDDDDDLIGCCKEKQEDDTNNKPRTTTIDEEVVVVREKIEDIEPPKEEEEEEEEEKEVDVEMKKKEDDEDDGPKNNYKIVAATSATAAAAAVTSATVDDDVPLLPLPLSLSSLLSSNKQRMENDVVAAVDDDILGAIILETKTETATGKEKERRSGIIGSGGGGGEEEVVLNNYVAARCSSSSCTDVISSSSSLEQQQQQHNVVSIGGGVVVVVDDDQHEEDTMMIQQPSRSSKSKTKSKFDDNVNVHDVVFRTRLLGLTLNTIKEKDGFVVTQVTKHIGEYAKNGKIYPGDVMISIGDTKLWNDNNITMKDVIAIISSSKRPLTIQVVRRNKYAECKLCGELLHEGVELAVHEKNRSCRSIPSWSSNKNSAPPTPTQAASINITNDKVAPSTTVGRPPQRGRVQQNLATVALSQIQQQQQQKLQIQPSQQTNYPEDIDIFDVVFHSKKLGLMLGLNTSTITTSAEKVYNNSPDDGVLNVIVTNVTNIEYKNTIQPGDLLISIGMMQLPKKKKTILADVFNIISSTSERPLTIRFSRLNQKRRQEKDVQVKDTSAITVNNEALVFPPTNDMARSGLSHTVTSPKSSASATAATAAAAAAAAAATSRGTPPITSKAKSLKSKSSELSKIQRALKKPYRTLEDEGTVGKSHFIIGRAIGSVNINVNNGSGDPKCTSGNDTSAGEQQQPRPSLRLETSVSIQREISETKDGTEVKKTNMDDEDIETKQQIVNGIDDETKTMVNNKAAVVTSVVEAKKKKSDDITLPITTSTITADIPSANAHIPVPPNGIDGLKLPNTTSSNMAVDNNMSKRMIPTVTASKTTNSSRSIPIISSSKSKSSSEISSNKIQRALKQLAPHAQEAEGEAGEYQCIIERALDSVNVNVSTRSLTTLPKRKCRKDGFSSSSSAKNKKKLGSIKRMNANENKSRRHDDDDNCLRDVKKVETKKASPPPRKIVVDYIDDDDDDDDDDNDDDDDDDDDYEFEEEDEDEEEETLQEFLQDVRKVETKKGSVMARSIATRNSCRHNNNSLNRQCLSFKRKCSATSTSASNDDCQQPPNKRPKKKNSPTVVARKHSNSVDSLQEAVVTVKEKRSTTTTTNKKKDCTSCKNSIATTSDETNDCTVALDNKDQGGTDLLPSITFDDDTTRITGSKWESLNEFEKEEFWRTVAVEKERNEKEFAGWDEAVFYF